MDPSVAQWSGPEDKDAHYKHIVLPYLKNHSSQLFIYFAQRERETETERETERERERD